MALAKPCSEYGHPESVGSSEAQIQAQSFLAGEKFEEKALALECQAWFAVFTSSHHEKRVSQLFTHHLIENFLPLYSEIHHWTNRRKVSVQLPLFPNYVFVRIARRQRGTSVAGARSPFHCRLWIRTDAAGGF